MADPIDELIETIEIPGTERVGMMVCKLCKAVLFDDSKDGRNVPLALHGLVAHFGIQHGILIDWFEYKDTGCLKPGGGELA